MNPHPKARGLLVYQLGKKKKVTWLRLDTRAFAHEKIIIVVCEVCGRRAETGRGKERKPKQKQIRGKTRHARKRKKQQKPQIPRKHKRTTAPRNKFLP